MITLARPSGPDQKRNARAEMPTQNRGHFGPPTRDHFGPPLTSLQGFQNFDHRTGAWSESPKTPSLSAGAEFRKGSNLYRIVGKHRFLTRLEAAPPTALLKASRTFADGGNFELPTPSDLVEVTSETQAHLHLKDVLPGHGFLFDGQFFETRAGPNGELLYRGTGESVNRLYHTTVTPKQSIDRVRFRGPDGGESSIEATGNHPLFVIDLNAYVRAESLLPGMHLRSPGGEPFEILGVERDLYRTTVYNFGVQSHPSYYVSGQLGGHVLVHNTNGPGNCGKTKASKRKKKIPKGGTYVLRDPKTGKVRRTGRSNDLKRRKGEHSRHPETENLRFEVVHRTDSYKAQRGLEHHLDKKYPDADLNRAPALSNRLSKKKRRSYLNAASRHLRKGK